MRGGMSTNVDALVVKWKGRANALRPQMRAATASATKTVLAESKKQMTALIYNKPIPTKQQVQAERKGRREAAGKVFSPRKTFTTAKGTANSEGRKPAWRRTGNLRRSEKAHVQSAYVGIIENPASSKSKSGAVSHYARPRHNSTRTRYPAQWRANAINATRAKVRTIYREAMTRAIKAGIAPGL